MKISINSKFIDGPYGGGMQFANFMREYLSKHGHTVVNNIHDNDIDIILHVNPFPDLTPDISTYSYFDAIRYKKSHPKTIIVERVNECDERKGTNYMNRKLIDVANNSDFVVFISSWLRPLLLKTGLAETKPYRVIKNGADERIFNIKNKKFWNGNGKIKIVTHHWSDNPKKGHRIYKQLDDLLENEDMQKLFEFTYIGRVPKSLTYNNTRILSPLSSMELSDELKRHDIYITATENEPAGMHHIEGALCGLPILYINSGALPEYCENFGLEFEENNLERKLIEIRNRFSELKDKIFEYRNTAEKMGGEYLNLFEELYAQREKFAQKKDALNLRKFIPKPIKYVLIFLYVMARCFLRSGAGKDIVLNMAGVLPPKNSNAIIHGGKVKLLPLKEKFGDSWKNFNLAYFVSSGLPFAPSIWLKFYKAFGIKIIWNQNGVAYPALYPPKVVNKINSLHKPMKLADHVIYQTEFTKKCADKFVGKYDGPSDILVNPVDTKHFIPRSTPLLKEPLVIMMSGNHFESKERMSVSLETLKKLIERGIQAKLIVIGNPEIYIHDEIKKLGIENSIELKGAFTQNEAPKLYQSAHILLHLKYLDPCPTIVLEALACGLPVVGMKSGGMPELVDENSGILIPIEEDFSKLHYPKPDEVADAIIKISNNLEIFSNSARTRSMKFDTEKWLEKHSEIFNNLLTK